MFHRLVAKPMNMSNYHLFLAPTSYAYGGGSHQFLPRDFMRLAQLMLNEGKWAGKQITSKEWAIKSGSAFRQPHSDPSSMAGKKLVMTHLSDFRHSAA